jgi:SHS2 domain-containing protein
VYEYLDHTADAGILAVGSDLAEALQEAARGMLHLQIPPGGPMPTGETRRLEVESADEEELVLDWLGLLLAEQDLAGCILVEAVVEAVVETAAGLRLRGAATAVPVQALRGRLESEVKAVTAYGLRVTRTARGVEIRVVVDL